ncbi:Glucose 1-dehydrogenase 1 [bacterium HR16]|nr:Glucose 1-dehydrogenase 1 [bacterium HR16]
MKRLEGKTAIVTGAAQGLGEAIAIRLAKEGCAGVTLADLQTEKAQAVAQGIEAESPWCKTLVVKCDVTSEADVIEMVQRHLQAFGKLDIMVANAGILIAHDITEFPADQWKRW